MHKNKLSCYVPPQNQLWCGRIDAEVPSRFYQVMRCLDLEKDSIPHDPGKQSFALLGFACDEGVRRNQGRVGAVEGPNAFRSALANLPINTLKDRQFFDVGNIQCLQGDLETAQNQLGKTVASLLLQGIHPLVIGGGHETAWGHYQGIKNTLNPPRLGIVNFDAHFDMRPLINGRLGSSGTSFLQIALDRQKQQLPFDYTCIGIQRTGNTIGLFESAKNLSVNYSFAEEVYWQNGKTSLNHLQRAIHDNDALYVSVCLDVFAQCYAPGVSAPQCLGLEPWPVIAMLRMLLQSGKVCSLDIVELSPVHDRNQITAKLAASLAVEYLLGDIIENV